MTITLNDVTPASVYGSALRISALRLLSRIDGVRERGGETIALSPIFAKQMAREMEIAADALDPASQEGPVACAFCPLLRLRELIATERGFKGLDARCGGAGNRVIAEVWMQRDQAPHWCPRKVSA